MEQYLSLKEQNKDAILLFRLGDFYEVFFDDAKVAAKELEITLTKRNSGLEEPTPMCGVPYHSVDPYIDRLIEKGYKVAIAEQMEDPSLTKGLVKREVVRIVTKGTNTNSLSKDENNYLACIYKNTLNISLAYCDVSTGEIKATTLPLQGSLVDEIAKIRPSQIICSDKIFSNFELINTFENIFDIQVEKKEDSFFNKNECIGLINGVFGVKFISNVGLFDDELAIAVGALLNYLQHTNPSFLDIMTDIDVYKNDSFMRLDNNTIRNLELKETIKDKIKKGSLFGILDKTKTAMGARLLRNFIEEPLVDKNRINARLDAVELLLDNRVITSELKEYLIPIYDIERIVTKLFHGSANARDMLALKQSLSTLVPIKNLIDEMDSTLFNSLSVRYDTLEDVYDILDESIREEAPISIKDGGIFKDGYNEYVDELREVTTKGTKWLAEFEAREKEKTGIKNLKVKYNKVFGYFLEVTNSNLNMVPDYFIRKQTMTNCERYFTDELKKMEDMILGGREKLLNLEYQLFISLKESLTKHVKRFKNQAKIISEIDVLVSFSEVSYINGYVKPTINEDGIIDIIDGRHPVVEKIIDTEQFISNDSYLDKEENRFLIITGPNMAGKSTYMRQVALITLMAQIGCFVPAREANISIVDRIFTRVGASDDLTSGRSTFMVEMTEVANIVRNATSNSLIILDEIGRGTSTFDGLSIAWAVTEYISDKKVIGAKTLFATHYHELTELEGSIDGVLNYSVDVRESGEDIVFLRKIIRGSAMKSYGIEVARLAGVPRHVVSRAKEILEKLEQADIARVDYESTIKLAPEQLTLFDNSNEVIIDLLKELDINETTPMEAFKILSDIKGMLSDD